jgi:hypothetical protein
MGSDIVQRLRVQSNTEEVMKSWDTLRAYLLDGGRGSLARDIFESILSHIDEEREEAADRIEALEAALKRISSMEGFTGSFALKDNNEGRELRARIIFAESVLKGNADAN